MTFEFIIQHQAHYCLLTHFRGFWVGFRIWMCLPVKWYMATYFSPSEWWKLLLDEFNIKEMTLAVVGPCQKFSITRHQPFHQSPTKKKTSLLVGEENLCALYTMPSEMFWKRLCALYSFLFHLTLREKLNCKSKLYVAEHPDTVPLPWTMSGSFAKVASFFTPKLLLVDKNIITGLHITFSFPIGSSRMSLNASKTVKLLSRQTSVWANRNSSVPPLLLHTDIQRFKSTV